MDVMGVCRFIYVNETSAVSDFSKRLQFAEKGILASVPAYLVHDHLRSEERTINCVKCTVLSTTIWVFPGISVLGGAIIARNGKVVDLIHGRLDHAELLAKLVIGTEIGLCGT
jgi:hypothetical protein